MLLLLIFYFVIIAALAACAIALLGSLRAEAPFVPTGKRDMRLMLAAAKIMPGEIVYDLGSGDGRFVRAAARQGARAVGFEQSRILVWWSRMWGGATTIRQRWIRSYKGPLPSLCNLGAKEINCTEDCRRSQCCSPAPPDGGRASFIRGDYLKENLSGADVIFCYLMPKAMEHLKEKFEGELKPGTRIFSRAFKIPDWTPRERLQFSKHSPPVYVYIR